MQPQLKQTNSFNQKLQQSKIVATSNEYSQQQSPINEYSQELFEDLIIQSQSVETTEEQLKSKSMKRKQKLQKIRADLKNPELRKQRNRQRHRKEKQKLSKALQSLSQEQIKQFLTQRKQQKHIQKDKVKKQVQQQVGQTFFIDMAYEHRMNEKQNKSLAAQIQLIVKTLKRIDPSPNVHLCGLKQGRVMDQLIKMHYQFWPIKPNKEPLAQYIKQEKFKGRNVYYLSPDSKKTVDTILPNDIFIIGGLVDRTVIKNASLNRAQQLGIQARSLPIRPFMKQRSCLNLDHIVSIVCKFVECQDWKQAFEYGAPKRWKKQQGEKGLKELSSESEAQKSQNNSQEEKVQQSKYEESKKEQRID